MKTPTQIYLDVSCLNRPFDDQSQPRIRLEAEAVRLILENADSRSWRLLVSEVAIAEIEATPDPRRRADVLDLLPDNEDVVSFSVEAVGRGNELKACGFSFADALHLAAGEEAGAAVFLTCDRRLLRRAKRLGVALKLRVLNPLQWLEEQDL
ncbi:MAG TPA: PIN domain-containing protein [Planctomycetota bacterium]|jgi:predicted nucleic acid-binding protein